MTKIFVTFAVLFTALIVVTGCQKSAPMASQEPSSATQTTNNNAEYVSQITSFISDQRNAGKFLVYKRYSTKGLSGLDVVFDHNGTRYSIYYTGTTDKTGKAINNPFLSVSTRPSGSKDKADLKAFSTDMTGAVWFGKSGTGKASSSKKTKTAFEDQLFIAEPGGPKTVGLQYKDYWQGRADSTLPDIVEYINKQKS